MSVTVSHNICVIDDDEEYTLFVRRYLTSVGHTVRAYITAQSFLADPEALNCDIFLVDLMLPGMDGIDLVSMIRANGDAGIIVVSGRMGADAFTTALAAGADMFVNKPVRADQIAQAIASLGRRLVPAAAKGASGWLLDCNKGVLVSPAADEIKLGPLEQRIVIALAHAADKGVSRAELAQISQVAPSADDRNLDAAMFRLRRKIENGTGKPSPILTMHGKGYALTAAIELANPA